MQEAEKIESGHNETGAPHHLSVVSQHDHLSRISHRTAANRPIEQRVSPSHVDREHLNGTWQQQLHQQQEASSTLFPIKEIEKKLFNTFYIKNK